jgi:hypothetical protein
MRIPRILPQLAQLGLAAYLSFAAPTTFAADASAAATDPGGKYRNFRVAIYIPVEVVNTFADPARLEEEWKKISSQMKVDKVYIETYRDSVEAEDRVVEAAKKFFLSHGVRIAGGITMTYPGQPYVFNSFCYTDPDQRAIARRMTEKTARLFDEIILDDFTFVTTKTDSDIAMKGRRSWTEFRLSLMNEVARNLILGPAKAVNPKVKVTIKYPNWYEHFQAMGFDLARGPELFDGIYTGTETRDPTGTEQCLQQYESYGIVRYFENIAPGRNGGGWVDMFQTRYADRYAQQIWDTLFAKPREITLFYWGGLLKPLELGERGAWEGLPTSFDANSMLQHAEQGAKVSKDPVWARAAGYALKKADEVVGHLGKPIGIASYRPPHGIGEDFLHNYIGMLGIPIELYPRFPDSAPVVILTEDAKGDPEIVQRIQKKLIEGGTVVMTSGLCEALQGRGLEDIVELKVGPRRFVADNFVTSPVSGMPDTAPKPAIAAKNILFPQVAYITNDAWGQVFATSDGQWYPLFLLDYYGKSGRLLVWTIPDNPRHLYNLPAQATEVIKNFVMKGFPVRLDSTPQIALYAYDNDTLVVESYLPSAEKTKVSVLGAARRLRDVATGESIAPLPPPPKRQNWEPPVEERTSFEVAINPHSFRALKVER